MNKSELIRQTKEKYPSYTTKQIAEISGVKQDYAAHILWKVKKPTKTKEDFQKPSTRNIIRNNHLHCIKLHFLKSDSNSRFNRMS